MKLTIKLVLFLSSILTLSLCYGENEFRHEASKNRTGVEFLSHELRALLKSEMLAIQNGMISIIPAYASGNWSEIVSIAHKMENSYILKQRLTDKHKSELSTLLPSSFIQLDQEFHYLSGMLKHAASNKKVELVGFYFSRLSEACVICHSRYATHKFPAFSKKQEDSKHSH